MSRISTIERSPFLVQYVPVMVKDGNFFFLLTFVRKKFILHCKYIYFYYKIKYYFHTFFRRKVNKKQFSFFLFFMSLFFSLFLPKSMKKLKQQKTRKIWNISIYFSLFLQFFFSKISQKKFTFSHRHPSLLKKKKAKKQIYILTFFTIFFLKNFTKKIHFLS